jgi:Family of unknown function (DUF6069)
MSISVLPVPWYCSGCNVRPREPRGASHGQSDRQPDFHCPPHCDRHPHLVEGRYCVGSVAAIATIVTADISRAADVRLAVKGESIPLAEFARLTFVSAMLGLILAKILSRRASNPQRMFLRATVVFDSVVDRARFPRRRHNCQQVRARRQLRGNWAYTDVNLDGIFELELGTRLTLA